MKLLNISIFGLLLVSIISIADADGGYVGINYGRLGNDLPPPRDVVHLIKSTRFQHAKIFDVNPDVLHAFSGSGVKLTVCLPNENITLAARNPAFATNWVSKNVVAAYKSGTLIDAIAVGNEVLDDTKNPGVATNLVNAMENIHNALVAHNLGHAIKVSSPLSYSAITNSYPPQAAEFSPKFKNIILSMLGFLDKTKSPLMMNVYPYFAYTGNPAKIQLEYALFQAPNLIPGPNGPTKYNSLFDSMVDGVFAAMEKVKYGNIRLVITESGWPSNGGTNAMGDNPATLKNAAAYNQKLVNRVLTGGGTPMRPNAKLTVYIFALFNENNKPGKPTEKHFGLFYPSKKKVYDFMLPLHSGDPTDQTENDETTSMHIENNHAHPVDHNQQNTHDFNTGMENELLANPHGHNQEHGAGGVTGNQKPPHGTTWCVAKKGVNDKLVQDSLDWVCTKSLSGGEHCSKIQMGQKCYEPNTLHAHASHAFNHYYQMHKNAPGSCNFNGAAQIVHTQPRYGHCSLHYRQ